MLPEEVRREERFVDPKVLYSFNIKQLGQDSPVTLGVDVYMSCAPGERRGPELKPPGC